MLDDEMTNTLVIFNTSDGVNFSRPHFAVHTRKRLYHVQPHQNTLLGEQCSHRELKLRQSLNWDSSQVSTHIHTHARHDSILQVCSMPCVVNNFDSSNLITAKCLFSICVRLREGRGGGAGGVALLPQLIPFKMLLLDCRGIRFSSANAY